MSRETAKGSILVRRAAQPGAQGLTYRTSVWKAGKIYRNDLTNTETSDGYRYIDIVTDVDIALLGTDTVNAYICKTTHVSGASNPLEVGTNWQQLESTQPYVTPILLAGKIQAGYIDVADLAADTAFIDDLQVRKLKTVPTTAGSSARIEAEDNAMSMYDSSGTLKMKISGDSLSSSESGDSFSFPSSSSFPYTFAGKIFDYSEISAGTSLSGSFTCGTFNITQSSNTVTLPSIGMQIYTNGSSISAGLARFSVSLWYCIDGNAYSVTSKISSVRAASKTNTVSFTFPAISTSVPVGNGHILTIGYSITPSGTVDDSVSVNLNFTASGSVGINYGDQITEVGGNGFQAKYGSNYYFIAKKSGSTDSTIEFAIRAGSYGIKVTDSGMYKMTNGTWVAWTP